MERKGQLSSIEETIHVPPDVLRNAWDGYGEGMLAKASMAVSPELVRYLQSAFPHIDFPNMRSNMESVAIEEVENIHSHLTAAVNRVLGSGANSV